jgi:hypothetical protein
LGNYFRRIIFFVALSIGAASAPPGWAQVTEDAAETADEPGIAVAALKDYYADFPGRDLAHRYFVPAEPEDFFPTQTIWAADNFEAVEKWTLAQIPKRYNELSIFASNVKILWLSPCGYSGSDAALEEELPSSYNGPGLSQDLLDRAWIDMAFEAEDVPLHFADGFRRQRGVQKGPDPAIEAINRKLLLHYELGNMPERLLILEPWCGAEAKANLKKLPKSLRYLPPQPPAPPPPPPAYDDSRRYFTIQGLTGTTWIAEVWRARTCRAAKGSATDTSCSAWVKAWNGLQYDLSKPGRIRCVSEVAGVRRFGDTRIGSHQISLSDGPLAGPVRLNCGQP